MTDETQGQTALATEQVQTGPPPSEPVEQAKEQVTTEAAKPEDQATEEQSEEARQGLSRSQRRTRAYHRAQTEKYEALERVKQLEAQLAAQPKSGPPKDTDYEGGSFNPKYIEDTVKFHAESAAKTVEDKSRESRKAEIEEARLSDRLNQFSARAAKEIPNVEKLAADFSAAGGTLSRDVRVGVSQLTEGPAVLEYILQNPDVADDLNDMPPFEAALELGELNRLVALKKTRTTTKAPAPIKPVSGGASTGQDPAKMSMADYIKLRKSQDKE